jgi:two-component system, LytTR family, sensor histidine kinase AlgZ
MPLPQNASTASRLPLGLSWRGLLAVLVMIALAMVAQMSDHQQVGLTHLVMLTWVGACFTAAYVLAHKFVVEPLELRARQWQKPLIRAVALVAAVLAGGELAAQTTSLLGGSIEEKRRNYLPVGFAVMAAIAVIDYGYQELRRRAREVELREERARRKAISAELAALRARTDPHFLFNSLNTLAGLIEENPRKATEVVERLASLFRYVLEGSRCESVRFGQELDAVRRYLELEAIRFGERFHWHLDVAPALEQLIVPPLFLQPLVENAVIHGAGPKRGDAHVAIRAARVGNRLHVEVEDDGGGIGSSPVRGSGSSLADLAERLDLLYGSDASFSSRNRAGGGVLVAVVLPIVEESAA